MATNLQVQLASRPTGWVDESNFRIAETPVPKPGPGQLLVKNLWLSLDPYMRGRMSDAKSYATPVQIGGVMGRRNAGIGAWAQHLRIKGRVLVRVSDRCGVSTGGRGGRLIHCPANIASGWRRLAGW